VNAIAIGTQASAAANSLDLRFGGASRVSGDSNGQIGINEASPGGQLQVTTGAAARKALIVKGAASQSANLVEIQNSSGTALFTVDSSGGISTIGSTGLVSKIQNGDYIWLGTTGGTATAQTATATPAITAYQAGQKFRMKIGSGLGSTGSAPTGHTLNVNGLGAKGIAVNDGVNSSPTIGTWIAGAILEVIYDGTYFQIINDAGGWATYTPSASPNTGTLSSINFIVSRFCKRGKVMFIEHHITLNTSSVGSYIDVSLPTETAVSANNLIIPSFVYNAGSVGTYIFNRFVTHLSYLSGYAGSAWGTKTGVGLYWVGSYESV
jgi:hypothetical protein